MSKRTTYSRMQRRAQFRASSFLKIKNMYSRFHPYAIEWYKQRREEGLNLHDQHTKRVEESIGEQLEIILEGNYNEETGEGRKGVKNTWRELGYNEEEIALLEEAWASGVLRDKETYREDKKKAKALRKEAEEKRRSRLNAKN